MPGFLAESINNAVLDCLFGGSTLRAPLTLHFGLSLARAYRGGFLTEPDAVSYGRVAVPNDRGHFGQAESGTKSNTMTITFPAPTEDWGTIASVFVADEAVGGRILAMADLPAPRVVRAGDVAPAIPAHGFFLTHH
jgi:hypothetical protein